MLRGNTKMKNRRWWALSIASLLALTAGLTGCKKGEGGAANTDADV